jgi:hypothetical protein
MPNVVFVLRVQLILICLFFNISFAASGKLLLSPILQWKLEIANISMVLDYTSIYKQRFISNFLELFSLWSFFRVLSSNRREINEA